MLKAYIKERELVAHGAAEDSPVVAWCREEGIVRVEVELKKRLLSELGLNEIGSLNDARLAEVFREQTAVFRAVDRSEEPDILAAIPSRSRVYASAWLAGQDMRGLVSERTLYRHARVLRGYGLDILAARSVSRFPVRVRVVELEPVVAPSWYDLKDVA